MKKYLIVLIVLLLCLTGCTSTSTNTSESESTSTNTELMDPYVECTIMGDDVASFFVYPMIWKTDYTPFDGTEVYHFKVTNKSDSVITVNWAKSAISYGTKTSLIFLDGQKYSESNTPMPSNTIPVSGELDKNIYASNCVIYDEYFGWTTGTIPSYYTTLLICIEHDGKETYYQFKCSPSTSEE